MDIAIFSIAIVNLILTICNGFLIIGVAGMIRKRDWRDVDDGR